MPADRRVMRLLEEAEQRLQRRRHHLWVGRCQQAGQVLHAGMKKWSALTFVCKWSNVSDEVQHSTCCEAGSSNLPHVFITGH
eukprot:347842-Chlamydomonas_euryale.AAC.3